MPEYNNFKKQKTFEERLEESNRIKESFPEKIPIILVLDNKILNDYIFMHLNIPKGIINDKLH